MIADGAMEWTELIRSALWDGEQLEDMKGSRKMLERYQEIQLSL